MKIFGKKTTTFTLFISTFILIGILFTSAILFRKSEVIEKLTSIDLASLTDASKGFCEVYRGKSHELEGVCNNMSQNTCSSMDCCVWANNSKCVAGGKDGPMYKTDSDGKPSVINNYYYKNTCYGNCN